MCYPVSVKVKYTQGELIEATQYSDESVGDDSIDLPVVSRLFSLSSNDGGQIFIIAK